MKSWGCATSDRSQAVADRLSLWVCAAWWASLSTLGFFVVPMLFAYLPSPALAGYMAGRLFGMQTGVSGVCTVLLLLLALMRGNSRVFSRYPAPVRWVPVVVALGLCCALVSEWVVAPHILAREDLALWHRLGSGLYLLQWLCAVTVFQLELRRQFAGLSRWHA